MAEKDVVQRPSQERAREREIDRLVEAYLREVRAQDPRRPARADIREILTKTEPRP